jgi:hypothetical protein
MRRYDACNVRGELAALRFFRFPAGGTETGSGFHFFPGFHGLTVVFMSRNLIQLREISRY